MVMVVVMMMMMMVVMVMVVMVVVIVIVILHRLRPHLLLSLALQFGIACLQQFHCIRDGLQQFGIRRNPHGPRRFCSMINGSLR